MVVDIHVVTAYVIITITMTPPPAEWPPPWVVPTSKPIACYKAEPKTGSPPVSKAGPEPVGIRPSDPIGSDVRPVVPTRAVDDNVAGSHYCAQITRRIPNVYSFRRRTVDPRIGHIMQR